jgi:tetratricopeptide (TPR) repeat protein
MAETDVTTELTGLRREVLEMRNLVIKTDNLLKTFHTELKEVSRKHQVSESRHQLGHIGGYAVIGAVALIGALLYGNAAGSGVRAEAHTRLEEAKQKEAEAQALLARVRQSTATQEQVATEVATVWKLLTSSDTAKQEEGVLRAAKLDTSKLPAFTREAIQRTAEATRRTRAEDALSAAFAEPRASDQRKAAAAFERFLALAQAMPAEWRGTERLQAAYQLGALYNGMGEHDKAVPYLRSYVAQGASTSAKGYAYLLLGDSLEKTNHAAEAAEAFKQGLRIAPSGVTSSLLKRRLGSDAQT